MQRPLRERDERMVTSTVVELMLRAASD